MNEIIWSCVYIKNLLTVRKKQLMFKIITLHLNRICRMQLSCKSIKLSVICTKSSLKSHQPGHISIMNTGHEINLTAILDLHVPLTLSVTSINVRSDRLNT